MVTLMSRLGPAGRSPVGPTGVGLASAGAGLGAPRLAGAEGGAGPTDQGVVAQRVQARLLRWAGAVGWAACWLAGGGLVGSAGGSGAGGERGVDQFGVDGGTGGGEDGGSVRSAPAFDSPLPAAA